MKLLIVTTDQSFLKWKTLPAKLKTIKTGLNKCKNGTWDIEVREAIGLVPEIVAGRITHRWFDTFSRPLFGEGYHHVYLHFSMKRWSELGLDASIRGANQIDVDFVGECYGRADENTKRLGLNQLEQNVGHEMSHELHRACKMTDMTHPYHAAHKDIYGIFTTIDLANWHPVYQQSQHVILGLMEKIAALLKAQEPTTLVHPVQDWRKYITQPYGVKNARYKKTGRHIGTDYALPMGTPLVAPNNGEVTTSGWHPDLGNYIHFTYSFQGEVYEERWCHLREKPKLGKYTRGHVVAFSGNTGDSSGPHKHREVWREDVRTDLINATNWSVLTLDPESLPYNQ
jgi:hypothetical protein